MRDCIVNQVSLGDTIGVGSAGTTRAMLDEVLLVLPARQLAVHCHDTYGQALANVLIAIEVRIPCTYRKHVSR